MERALHHLSWAVIFLLIFSCQRDFEPTSPPIPINEGHRNFPLHVGDTWKYEIVRCDFKRELVGQMVVLQITEKVEINGEKYFLFDSNFPRWVCPLDSGLFRVEGRKVFRYFKGKEYMWYDFGAIPGYEFDPKADRWEVPSFAPAGYGMLVQIISIVDCSELSGASVVGDSCYEFYFFEGADAGWFEYFAPELGHIAFYSISWTPTWYDIREAIIGGKRYKFKY